ncbi:hypothetical protein Tco_1014276, partial [Tanacetum coccineum]
MRPLAGSRDRAPCWGLTARSAGEGRGGAALHWGLGDMTTRFGKLDKFEGSDFRHWQKKMHFLLTTLKVAYVLSNPGPEFVEE